MNNKEKEISLSELLSTDFIIVDDKMVGTFPLDRINMISDVLKQQKEEIERLNKDNGNITKLFAKEREKTKRLNNIINELERYINEEYIYDELGMKIFDASKLQDKLQELKGENNG